MSLRHVGRLLVASFVVSAVTLSSEQAWATPANVAVVLSESMPGIVHGGEVITYTYTVGNSGSTDSGPITVTGTVPSNVDYHDGSASCGTTSNCMVGPTGFIGAASCVSIPSGENELGCRNYIDSVSWDLSSVAAGASGLALSYVVTVLSPPVAASGSWTGGGCGQTSGCPTNEVDNPGPDVQVDETTTPSPASFTGAGTPVMARQQIEDQISLGNSGDAPSGTITVTNNLPTTTGLALVAGSPTCGMVPSCTVTKAGSASCSSGPCPGTTVVWTIGSLAPGAANLVLGFATTVLSTAVGSVTSHTMWNGSIDPPIDLSGVEITGDGCIYIASVEPGGCFLANMTHPVTATPIPQVTNPHTGEPWAGTRPVEAVAASAGFGLLMLGEARRRRCKAGTARPHDPCRIQVRGQR